MTDEERLAHIRYLTTERDEALARVLAAESRLANAVSARSAAKEANAVPAEETEVAAEINWQARSRDQSMTTPFANAWLPLDKRALAVERVCFLCYQEDVADRHVFPCSCPSCRRSGGDLCCGRIGTGVELQRMRVASAERDVRYQKGHPSGDYEGDRIELAAAIARLDLLDPTGEERKISALDALSPDIRVRLFGRDNP